MLGKRYFYMNIWLLIVPSP